MANFRHTNEKKWQKIKIEYETNPAATFRYLESRFKVSLSTIHERAKKEGWNKESVQQEIIQRSDIKLALSNQTPNRTEDKQLESSQITDNMNNIGFKPNTKPNKITALTELESTIELQATKLAGIRNTHRETWVLLRTTQILAIQDYSKTKEPDFEKLEFIERHAKIFRTIQTGELEAWGINPKIEHQTNIIQRTENIQRNEISIEILSNPAQSSAILQIIDSVCLPVEINDIAAASNP